MINDKNEIHGRCWWWSSGLSGGIGYGWKCTGVCKAKSVWSKSYHSNKWKLGVLPEGYQFVGILTNQKMNVTLHFALGMHYSLLREREREREFYLALWIMWSMLPLFWGACFHLFECCIFFLKNCLVEL